METNQTIKILVIDDEPLIRSNIAAYLEDSDFTVFQAENGKVGLDILNQEKPDAVLTDLDMPVIDGYSFLTEIRQITVETPVIIITGIGDVPSAVKASKLGAWDFILKPIHNMAVVEHAIRQNLLKRSLIQENREYKESLEEKVHFRTKELKDRTHELEHSNIKLKKEVGTRRLAEAQLRQANNRISSLRDFSNRISEFSDEGLLLHAALEELCENIYVSGAILFHQFERDGFSQSYPGKPDIGFLHSPLTFDLLRKIFTHRSQEISIFNRLTDQWIIDFYLSNSPQADIKKGHFVFIRAQSLHQHTICLFRDPLYAVFDESDVEYIKHMIREVNIAYHNIQVLRENIWLENELRSTNLSHTLFRENQTHHVAGFEITSASVLSKRFERNSYHVFSQSDNITNLLITDVPGRGISSIMYNSIAGDLLARNEGMKDPSAMIATLNNQVQTGFQPNRFLTWGVFSLNPDKKEIQYALLGVNSLMYTKISHNTYSNISPTCYPFTQIRKSEGAGLYKNQKEVLDFGDWILCVPSRIYEIKNHENKLLDPKLIVQIIQNTSSEKSETILAGLSEELEQFFSGTSLPTQDNISITLIRREKTAKGGGTRSESSLY